MKDVFAKRARQEYAEAMAVFLEEVKLHCPNGEYLSAYESLLGDSGCEAWVKELSTDLSKVKYSKAVLSITSSNAKVGHALAYRDADAAEASCALLAKLKFAKATEEQSEPDLWWETIHEACAKAFRAIKQKPPEVPSKEAIAADIASRKRSKGGGKQGPAVLTQGTEEVLKTVFGHMESTPPEHAVERFKKLVVEEGWQAERPQLAVFLQAFDLSAEAGERLTDESWSLLQQAVTFTSIEVHIPCGMMRGIESVAQELAADGAGSLANAALDPKMMSKIGEKVLGGVDSSDVSSFASNIDKLLPIIANATKRA